VTPEQLAQIHSAAFTLERGWTAAEFTDLIASAYVNLFTADGGFALTRTVAGESELLTLAVHPDHQRRGIALGLLSDWIAAIQPHVETAFLEVAADNHRALALYQSAAFTRSGQRKAYYARNGAPAVDAVLMSRAFP